MAEVVDIAIGAQATDDFGPWWSLNRVAPGGHWDLSVIADADPSLLAPDKRPPRAGRGWAQSGAFLGEGLLACGVWSHAQFAVDFVLVDVQQELVEQAIGAFQIEDAIGGQEWGQAFLPVIVSAFDFALGLRRGGVTQGDPVEV